MRKIKTRSEGEGESGWIQAYCSCGWEGKLHYAYEDFQRTNLKHEKTNHKCNKGD